MNARHSLSFLLALAIPLAGLLVSETPALAQGAPPAAAAKSRTPITKDGRFARFVIAPHGQIIALVMQDGTVVHVPRDATQGPVGSLKPGDLLHVEGVAKQTPTGIVVMRAVVQRDGTVIADGKQRHARGEKGRRGERGERGKGRREHAPLAPTAAAGRVAAMLSSPRGGVHALLLDDGTTASGHGIESLGLRVGDRVSVNGKGGTYAQGKALRIETITLPNGETRALPKPERKHRGRGGKGKSAPV